jgi:hypothetical protein
MATTKAKAIEKGDSSPLDEPTGLFTGGPDEALNHSAPEHDWRNPDAKFAKDDHCPNAELARLARR